MHSENGGTAQIRANNSAVGHRMNIKSKIGTLLVILGINRSSVKEVLKTNP